MSSEFVVKPGMGNQFGRYQQQSDERQTKLQPLTSTLFGSEWLHAPCGRRIAANPGFVPQQGETEHRPQRAKGQQREADRFAV